MFFVVLFLFYCFLGTCTLDRFPGGDRMKPLPFLGIFMFALRWQRAECVVRFVAAVLVFKSGTTLFFVPHLDWLSDFII